MPKGGTKMPKGNKLKLYQAFREEFFRRLDQKTDWTNDEVKELFDEVVLWILNN